MEGDTRRTTPAGRLTALFSGQTHWGVKRRILPRGVFPPSLRGRQLYTYAASFRVLGVALGASLGFEEHIGGVIDRTMIRHGVMAQLARTSWDLEAGLLRSTQKALITNVTGYGLELVGSFAYDGLMGRLDTQGGQRRCPAHHWCQ